MKKSLLVSLPVAAFVAGMAVVPSVFADTNCNAVNQESWTEALQQCENITLAKGATISVEGMQSIDATNKPKTLDLNGGTISRSDKNGNTVLYITGGTFTVNDTQGTGKIVYETQEGQTQGPTQAITVGAGATLTINSGTLEGDGGVGVWGNGATINFGGTAAINATGNAINGNGAQASNAHINISGGTINSSEGAVVYMPQTGELKITGGDMTGYVGVVSRAGTVSIDGGTITATGTDPVQIGDAKDVKFPGGVAVIVDNKTPGYAGNSTPSKATIGSKAIIKASNTTDGAVLAYENSDNAGEIITIAQGATFDGATPAPAYLNGLVVGPNNVVMTPAEAAQMEADLANQNANNPNTADSIALYITIAAIALLGLGATALIAKKANR